MADVEENKDKQEQEDDFNDVHRHFQKECRYDANGKATDVHQTTMSSVKQKMAGLNIQLTHLVCESHKTIKWCKDELEQEERKDDEGRDMDRLTALRYVVMQYGKLASHLMEAQIELLTQIKAMNSLIDLAPAMKGKTREERAKMLFDRADEAMAVQGLPPFPLVKPEQAVSGSTLEEVD